MDTEFFGLDLTDVVTNDDLLEKGEYEMVADKVEVKKTKSGEGEYLNVRLKVTSGEREGKTIYTMFNTKNPNSQAVQIGLGQLKSFMKASGWTAFNLKSVTDLEGSKAMVGIKLREEEGYGLKEVVSYFKPIKQSLTDAAPNF